MGEGIRVRWGGGGGGGGMVGRGRGGICGGIARVLSDLVCG